MEAIWTGLFTIALCAFIYKYFIYGRRLPPGPYGVPIFGFLPFIDAKKPHITLTELSKKYGPIYSIKMGNVFTVVLSDHKLVRESFSKDSITGRAPLFLTHGIMKGNGLICAEGVRWKDQRRLVTMWLKNFGMTKYGQNREQLETRICSAMNEAMMNFQRKRLDKVDMNSLLSNMIGNAVNDLVFGFKFPEDDVTWKWLRHIQEVGCNEMGVAGVVNFLPFIRFFSKSLRDTMSLIVRGQRQTHRLYSVLIAKRREMLKLPPPPGCEYPGYTDILDDYPRGIIECVRYDKNSDCQESHFFNPNVLIPCEGECVLDNFLKEQSERFRNDSELSYLMTDEQLMFLLADLFGAGLDTTVVTLEWMFLFLALNPEVQPWIREEIEEKKQADQELNTTELTRLYATFCETQRIRSIVPVGIPHGCIKDTVIAGYVIPKGSMVIPLQWAMHMDPSVWEHPEKFNPSRFLNDDGTILKPQEFIPFQTGKRMCPGDELARMVAMTICARIIGDYSFRLDCKKPDEQAMFGHVGVTLAPPHVLYRFDPM